MTTLPTDEIAKLAWRKSQRSGGESNSCVEVAELAEGGVAVRNSRSPQGPALVFTAHEWAAFAGGMRDGEFDYLLG